MRCTDFSSAQEVEQEAAAIAADPSRLARLRQLSVLDASNTEALDRITRLASVVLEAPIVALGFLEADRYLLTSAVGLPAELVARPERPLSQAFCHYSLALGGPLVIEDAREHPLLCQHIATQELGLGGCVSVPLVTSDGFGLGALSAVDRRPRRWTDCQVGILQDLAASVVTEVERSAAVRERDWERRAREAALGRITDGFVALDREWRFTYLNPPAAELCQVLIGKRPECLLGRDLWDEWPAGIGTTFYREYRRAMDEQTPVAFEDYCAPVDRWFSVHAYPSSDGLSVYFQDISERKRAEERAVIFQTLGQRLNEATTPEEAGRVILQIADDLIGWDACWLELIDPDEKRIRTTVLMDVVNGERVDVPPPGPDLCGSPMARQALEEGPILLLRDPQSLKSQDTGQHARFGDTGRLSASILCVPIRHVSRDVGAVSIQSYACNAYTKQDLELLRSLADYCAGALMRTQAEAAREHLQQQLSHAQKMEAVGRLAGGIAHDFNNMLAVINGYCELLSGMMPADEQTGRYLREIHEAGRRAAQITRQLLAFSRKQLLETRVIDLNGVVRDADRLLRRLIGEDIELITDLDPGLGRVEADPTQIEQVIVNLAVNARDAMPTGGKLTLRTQRAAVSEIEPAADLAAGTYALLEVEDTGLGMEPDLLAQIFEPFFTTKELGRGTGLGLATVYGIIKQSRGHIAVESEPNVGTRFKIYLPEIEREERADMEAIRAAPPGGNETILLVEDEPMVRQMVRTVLSQCGYTVLDATQGDEALRLAAAYEGEIHLLLTDVVMPIMGGRELAERIKAQRPDIEVLFISGYTDDAVVRHGLEQAQVQLLAKPFSHFDLAQRVRQLLDRSKPRPTRGRLLIVDDDGAQRDTLTEILQDQGYFVATAAEGQEALALLRSGLKVDLILLDLVMQGMNGWVFRLEQQREPAFADIPVIIMSGHHDPADVAEFLKPAGYLTKPLDVEQLLRFLAEHFSTEAVTSVR